MSLARPLRPLLQRPAISTCPTIARIRPLSTSPLLQEHTKRITKDRNPKRGMSPMRGVGPKQMLETEQYDLPRPVLDPKARTEVKTDEDHGLWGFFHEKKCLPTPEEDHAHGRAWTAAELRIKSWDDLHRLWWACVKERNIIATQQKERERLDPGYGEYESEEREAEVIKTQKRIRYVLTERYYAWEEAREIAETDPEVNLSGVGQAYVPVYEETFEQTKA
ncbi:MRP-L47-domain-containing protein [Ascodesmis nigricans]|uniref:Large ribosomal subunit protein uL29m n=1 Tax=Ascodesmis nigricans TaxID=341454 RepID=A0A4S2N5R6_9PEZI|nr:MRP-L47-domain-containing protein [Ascodesmis nigricans]